jgi:hypothetical protein
MKYISKQKGFALLLFVTVLVTAAATVSVKALNSASSNNQIDRDKITAAALAQAKDALIGYAITYAETHSGNVDGYLPCPDQSGTAIGGEGASEGVCGAINVSSIGRLPWKTLDLPVLRGGDNECLWYAVSGTYKYNPQTGLMNWDTNGLLQVYASDGTTLLTPANNQAVAVIFSPGDAASTQNRSGTTAPVCGGNYTASNYLDSVGTINNASVSTTANVNSRFRMGNPALRTSDHIVFITKQDIWNAMQKRSDFLNTLNYMTQQVAICIAGYGSHNNTSGNKSLPWPAQLSLTDYSVNTNYNDYDELSVGRVPYKVNTSRVQTGNSIASPYYLLQADGANCPVPAIWAGIYPWWNNWKDQLFYAVSKEYQPDNSPTGTCDSGHCLSVNGLGMYAAVVIFSNTALSTQNRASDVTDSQRGNAANYLEGSNAYNIASSHSNGNEDYQLSVTSSTFNDIVYCIKQDLSVVKGDATLTPVCP